MRPVASPARRRARRRRRSRTWETTVRSDPAIVALELRLAAREKQQAERRLTEQRLLELAAIVEDAISRIDAGGPGPEEQLEATGAGA